MALQSANIGSTCFSDLSYDDETGELTMEFVKGGQYVIPNFPADEWDRWSNSASLGGYFNSNIRGNY